MAIARQVYSYDNNGFQTVGEKSRYVEFDVENNRFRTYFWVTKKPNIKQYKKIIIGEWQELPEKIEFYESGDYNFPPAYIKFKPNGSAYTPDSGAPVIFDFAIVDTKTIEGDEAQAKTRIIEVIGVTGLARVHEK